MMYDKEQFTNICRAYGLVETTPACDDCSMTFPEFPRKTFVRRSWDDFGNEIKKIDICYPPKLMSECEIGATYTLTFENEKKFIECLENLVVKYKKLYKRIRPHKIGEL